MTDQTVIALNAVRAERIDDFEEWMRSVVVPAIRQQRPDLDGRWRVLRATDPDDDGAVVFAFVCEGGEPADWDLRPYLEHAIGAAEADRALEEFGGMLRGEQQAWFFRPAAVDRA